MKNSLIVLLFFLSVSILYAQDTINVPFDYPTIQEGINASFNGDVVLVHPGSYYENFNFSGKLITVASLFLTTQDTNYIYQTVVEGDTCESVIFESGEDSTARLIGFTFQNAHILLDTRGVIYCVNSSPVIMNNRIINNTIGSWPNIGGGGIVCIDASPFIGNNIISDNDIRTLGGGIYCRNSSPTIIDNIIKYNHVGDLDLGIGGGIYCENSSPYIEGNYITDNCVAGGYSARGGGIYCTNSSANIVGNYITDNCAGGGWGATGAGIFCNEASTVTITGNNIISNGAFGVYSNDFSSLTIINNLISENADYDNGGWGIGCFNSIMTLINNTIISNGNQPGGSGGIVAEGSSLTIDSCVISDNNGSGVCYMDYGDVSIIEIHNCNITGNSLYGVVNHTSVIINAEYNWWGDVSGPGGAGPGQGDSVSQNVDYEPWLINPITEVEELRISSTPNEYQVYQNYPNPFNPRTKIQYSLPEISKVSLTLFNLLGEEVKTLLNEEKAAGNYTVEFNAANLPSGVYFYRLQAGDFISTKKMILLK